MTYSEEIMNAQDELDRISDNLRKMPEPKIEYVSLHPIYCECAQCKVVQYKEKLSRDSKNNRVSSTKLQTMLREQRFNG